MRCNDFPAHTHRAHLCSRSCVLADNEAFLDSRKVRSQLAHVCAFLQLGHLCPSAAHLSGRLPRSLLRRLQPLISSLHVGPAARNAVLLSFGQVLHGRSRGSSPGRFGGLERTLCICTLLPRYLQALSGLQLS